MKKFFVTLKNYYFNLRLLPFKPQLVLRILQNYYRILILRQPCLRVLTLAMNYACQLSCRHCSADDFMQKEKEITKISWERLQEVLQEAEACGAINVHFTGGEPLLNKDLYKIMAMVNVKRNILSVVTNGLLLPREAVRLKKAGMNLVIVSLDSSNPHVHDSIRGAQGAHAKAWAGIDAARKAGLNVMVAMVVATENLLNGDVDEQVRLCRERGLMLQLLPARSAGKLAGSDKVWLNAEAKQKYYRLVEQGLVRWDGQSSYLGAQCLAARERIYVNVAGDVFPCDFIQSGFGNVAKEPLPVIWERMLSTAPFHERHSECVSAFHPELLEAIR